MSDTAADFIFFFSVIDPIGTVPVFLAATLDLDDRARRRVALRASAWAAVILVFFVVAGEIVLVALGIPLAAFQVAGGIVLFLFALQMLFGESKPQEELHLASGGDHVAIFPLAVPSLASPGAMLGAVLMTEKQRYQLIEQAQTTLVMLGVVALAYLLMLAAGRIQRLIGDNGASAISRVMGMILGAVAVTNVLDGLKSYFGS